MNVKKTIYTFGFLALAAGFNFNYAGPAMSAPPARPAPPQVLTLKDCLQRVMAENPAVRALRFDLEALERRAAAIRESYLPQLIATGQVGYVSGSSISYFSVIGVRDPEVLRGNISGLDAYRSGGGQLTFPLINGGSFFGINTPPAATVKQMELKATGAGYELTVQQILYSVTNTYLAVVIAKNKLELLDRQRKLANEQYHIAKEQLPYGLDTQGDVDTAQKAALQSEQAYEADTALAVQSYLELSMMLGLDDPHSFAIQATYPPMPKLPTYPFLISLIQDHHPSVIQQEAVLGEAKAQLAYDQNRIWPTVNYQGNYAYADDFSNPGANLWTSFVTVNIPIFDFGVLHNTARADLATVEADSLRVQAAKDDLLQNLYASYSAIRDSTYAAAAINGQVAAVSKQIRKNDILQSNQSISTGQYLATQLTFLQLRIAQEDTTLRNILTYAQLQNVTAGKWQWLNLPATPPLTAETR